MNRFVRLVLVASGVPVLLTGLSACSSGTTPAAPSPTATPAPTAAAVSTTVAPSPSNEVWTVKIGPSVVDGTLPAGCADAPFYQSIAGYTTPVSIDRTATYVDFRIGDPKYWEPIDFDEYTGAMNGSAFTAKENVGSFGLSSCAPNLPFSTSYTITGTFSQDGLHFTGEELDEWVFADFHRWRRSSWTGDLQASAAE